MLDPTVANLRCPDSGSCPARIAMMPILLADTLSTLAALILCVPVFVLPGAGFARWLALPGFDRAELGGKLALSLIASIAGLPVLLDLAGRVLGRTQCWR